MSEADDAAVGASAGTAENPYSPPSAAGLSQERSSKRSGPHPVPLWILVFCWIFLASGLLLPVLLVGKLVWGWEVLPALDFDTFEGRRALFLTSLVVLNAIAAYGLMWRRDWGLYAGLFAGLIGLTVSVTEWVVAPRRPGCMFTLQLAPFLQLAFIVTLLRMRKAWPQKRR